MNRSKLVNVQITFFNSLPSELDKIVLNTATYNFKKNQLFQMSNFFKFCRIFFVQAYEFFLFIMLTKSRTEKLERFVVFIGEMVRNSRTFLIRATQQSERI